MPPARLAAEITAYDAQAAALADWATRLPDTSWDADTVLGGWTVRTLVGHVVGSKAGLAEYLGTDATGPPTPIGRYVQAYRTAADDITAASVEIGAGATTADLLTALRAPTVAAARADADLVAGPRGPITALDFARLRTLDLVVHCDDASRSFPDGPAVELIRAALASAVRAASTALTQQAPGRSVELRVPPFVAVQAVAGPRHTRGTPPNVVETDPLTWLRLATGRLAFTTAAGDGTVRATGSRSDLTAFLPVLA